MDTLLMGMACHLPTNSSIYLLIQGYDGTTWTTILSTTQKAPFNSGNYQEYRYLLVAQGNNREYNNCKIKISISINDIIYEPYRPPIETTIYHDEPYFTNDYIRKDKDGGVEYREWVKVYFRDLTFTKDRAYDDRIRWMAYVGKYCSVGDWAAFTRALRSNIYKNDVRTISNLSATDDCTIAIYNTNYIYIYDSEINGKTEAEAKERLKDGYVILPLKTPTDTPKDLPDIVTASGYNSIDTDTQIKPEKMEIAYR